MTSKITPLGKTRISLTTANMHPIASILPDMKDADFMELVNDIAANGVQVPILTKGGKVVDGRHRIHALAHPTCEKWREGAPTQEVDADTAISSVVIGANLVRRHLSAKQRAQLVLDILRADGIEPSERQLAAAAGVSSGTAHSVKTEKELLKVGGGDSEADKVELIAAMQDTIDALEEQIAMLTEGAEDPRKQLQDLASAIALQRERDAWRTRARKAEASVKYAASRTRSMRKALQQLRDNDGIGSVEEVRAIVDPVLEKWANDRHAG